ncbi:uncharacterized protein KY384_008358 [Bacidia gigantensis]|uniref:uncharacterized protein n=1 Tax=Bacidia gigantensis TaxID=2732470 RepID=UPI001D0388CE|nr:uncharacterized protein KY384_008358 [Bacidia gigantensis]KAG8526929.1 hypothetical protein KY384_008358 [Bacidia gigantensis]
MHFQQIVASLALTSLAVAAPLSEEKRASPSEKFTVFQDKQARPEGRKVAGPIALAEALGKYGRVGLSPSPAVKQAAAKAAAQDDGTVAANPEQFDQAYLSPVTIGGETLQLDFDTGSSDLKISYGDGSSASGDVYTDSVDIGGTTVNAQAVELAKTVSAAFASNEGDGLLGLAFSKINTVTPDQQKTFFDNAIPSLSEPLFAVDLKKGQAGTYDFGFIDDSKHTGEITYTPVDDSQGFWGFTTSGYKVGDGETVTEDINSIADTGTSLALLQDDVVSAYYAAVDGAENSQSEGGYIFPCDATLPDLTFQIEDYAAVVPGSFFNYAPASAEGQCFGGLQSSGDLGLSIFGDVFLKAQYVVFSNSPLQLGFAPKDL